MIWDDATIALLRAFWDEGLTTKEIGRRLGASRNAVIGKAHRLNLPARPSPIVRNGVRAEPRPRIIRPHRAVSTLPALAAAAEARRIAATAKRRLTQVQFSALGRAPAKPPELTVEQLRLTLPVPKVALARSCQFPIWPHGEKPPRDVAKRFCNAPSHGSYCAEHHGRCYVKRSDLRWAA